MKFVPFFDTVEVEPISFDTGLVSDNQKFIEAAKVVGTLPSKSFEDYYPIKVGDILFFRPHGFFELPEYEGKKRYVVKVDKEFILGILKQDD